MGVVIESQVWEPRPSTFLFLAFSCFASVFLFPHFARNNCIRPSAASLPIDVGVPKAPFARFQRTFLLVYSLASLTSGLESVFGEYEFSSYGFERSQVILYLSVGAATALFAGTFLGMLSDVMGPRKFCILFCILHLVNGVLMIVTKAPNGWFMSICLSLATSILSFSFETWMVSEHDKQGYRQDSLIDTFWLMTYFGSAILIGSQLLANVLARDLSRVIFCPSAPAAFLSLSSIVYVGKEWNVHQKMYSMRTYMNKFHEHVLYDRRVWLLISAQACLHFSESIFWNLWAPTIVADGRDARLSLLYPCFLGSRMLGSTCVPWFYSASSPLFSERHLKGAFIIAGFCLSIVAYDYQEIVALVILFCIYNVCLGLISPSLAYLRAMHVPSELRGGMISLSLAPSNAIILFVLIQGGYHRNINNSTILAFSALALFLGAYCCHALKRGKKQSRQNWHHM